MNKAVFLDRDGTINVDYGYVYQPEKFDYIEGVMDSLKQLHEMGYLLIVITNQSGIARGYYTEEAVRSLHQKMCRELAEYGAPVTHVYYCPHLTGCTCRKPLTGMFYQAARDYDINMAQSLAVGDKLRDLTICEQEPVEGFWITQSEEPAPDGIHKISHLRDIVTFINENTRQQYTDGKIRSVLKGKNNSQ